MASFSVVNNIAAANAQANLATTNIGLQQGVEPAVERSPHQQLGRRRGRPGRGERLPVEHRGAEPGHPQRRRRPVHPADQGRRAQQHLEPARSSRDPGHAVGVLERHGRTARRWTSSSRTCSPKSTAKRRSPVSTPSGGFSVFVSNDCSNGTIGGTVGAADTAGLALTGLAVDTDVERGRRRWRRSRPRSATSAACRRRSERSRTGSSTPSRWRSRRS